MKFLIFIFLSIYCLHSEDAWVPHEFGAKSKFVNYGEVIPIYSEGTLVTYNKNNYIKFDTSQILKQENSMNFEFAHFKNNMTEFIKISHEVSKDNNKTYINTLLEKYKNGVKTNDSKTLVKSFDMKEFSLIDFNCYTRVLDDSLCAIVSTYTYYLAQLKITESSTIFYNVLDNNYYVVAGKLSSYNRKSKIAIVITNYISENLADKIITQNNRLMKVKYGYENTLLYILSSLKVKHYETNVGETGNVILLKNVTDKRNEIFKYEYPKDKRIYTFKDDYLDCLISSNDNAIFILDSNGNLRSKMISSPEEDFLFELQPLNIRKLLFVMNDYLYCLDDQNYIHKINLTEKASRCEFYSDSIAIIGLPYKLNNLSIGDISSHRWYIDYDYRVLDMSPNILFYETGEKVIKLKCYYNNGSRSKIYLDTVRVYEIKDLEFDYKVIDKEKRIVEF